MRFASSADWSVPWISFSALSNVFLDLSVLIWNYFSFGSGSSSFTFSVCATRQFIPTPLPSPFFIFNWPVLFVAFFFFPPLPLDLEEKTWTVDFKKCMRENHAIVIKRFWVRSGLVKEGSIGVFSRSSIPSWREKYTSSKNFNFLIC